MSTPLSSTMGSGNVTNKPTIIADPGDINAEPLSMGTNRHRRTSSIIMLKHMRETPEQLVDQAVGPNVNAEWVNMKGAWVIHVVLIVLGKFIINAVPGISDSMRWTIVNLGYMVVSYIIFHYVKGAPLDLNSGAYDELTLWEQIDQGYQYTPAKKYLTSLPIALFLLSTHYSHYNPWLFTLNLMALLVVLFPKLPIFYRSRLFIFPKQPGTGANTPTRQLSVGLEGPWTQS